MDINNNFFAVQQNELVDLRVYQSGAEKCVPNKHYGPFARQHYLFHYIHEGKGVFEFQNAKNELITKVVQKGQGFLCYPGKITTYIADEKTPWVYSWIEIDGIHVSKYFGQANITVDNPIFTPKTSSFNQQIDFYIKQISQTNNEMNTLELLGNVYLFLNNLHKSMNSKRTMNYHNRINDYITNAIYFMTENLHKNITVNDIADYCLLTPYYLSKIFKDKTGKTLKEFLIHLRLTKSTTLLKDTDLSIKEISMNVGYSNQLYFSKAFNNKYNVSPTTWRKSVNIKNLKE